MSENHDLLHTFFQLIEQLSYVKIKFCARNFQAPLFHFTANSSELKVLLRVVVANIFH